MQETLDFAAAPFYNTRSRCKRRKVQVDTGSLMGNNLVIIKEENVSASLSEVHLNKASSIDWNNVTVKQQPSNVVDTHDLVNRPIPKAEKQLRPDRSLKRKLEDEEYGIIETAIKNVPSHNRGLQVESNKNQRFRLAAANGTNLVKEEKETTSSNGNGEYRLVKNEILVSPFDQYQVLDFLGKGTFGQVAKCLKRNTNEVVAVKILKRIPSYVRQGQIEISILSKLSRVDGEEYNLVRAMETFYHHNHACLVFELLQENLYEYLKKRRFNPLPLYSIRAIVQQVLTALDKLKEIGIIHADLKPENIMLVDVVNRAFKVKVIDFGSASFRNRAVTNTYLQSRYYRAPEIILGLQFDEAIDVWSLGCIMAELFLGLPLYPGSSEYDQIRFITATQGIPQAHLLNAGKKAKSYFCRPNHSTYSGWNLKTPQQYERETGVKPKDNRKYRFTNLDEIVRRPNAPITDENSLCDQLDRGMFVDLLRKMLAMESNRRISPTLALKHPFIRMTGLVDYRSSDYVRTCFKQMEVCSNYDLISIAQSCTAQCLFRGGVAASKSAILSVPTLQPVIQAGSIAVNSVQSGWHPSTLIHPRGTVIRAPRNEAAVSYAAVPGQALTSQPMSYFSSDRIVSIPTTTIIDAVNIATMPMMFSQALSNAVYNPHHMVPQTTAFPYVRLLTVPNADCAPISYGFNGTSTGFMASRSFADIPISSNANYLSNDCDAPRRLCNTITLSDGEPSPPSSLSIVTVSSDGGTIA